MWRSGGRRWRAIRVQWMWRGPRQCMDVVKAQSEGKHHQHTYTNTIKETMTSQTRTHQCVSSLLTVDTLRWTRVLIGDTSGTVAGGVA